MILARPHIVGVHRAANIVDVEDEAQPRHCARAQPWGRIGMADFERSDRVLVKGVIILLVFPVLVGVLRVLLFPIFLLLAPVISRLGNWSESVGTILSIASLVVGTVGAAMITRLIWPKRPSQPDASCVGPDPG
jgi:hypothetical protein